MGDLFECYSFLFLLGLGAVDIIAGYVFHFHAYRILGSGLRIGHLERVDVLHIIQILAGR